MKHRVLITGLVFLFSALAADVQAKRECKLEYHRSNTGLAPVGIAMGKLGTERITLNAGQTKYLRVTKKGAKKRGFGNHLRRAKNVGRWEINLYVKDVRNHWVNLKRGKRKIFQAHLKRVSCPRGPRSNVTKNHRDLLIFLSNLAKPGAENEWFYKFVEAGAEKLAVGALSGKYRKIHVVKGAAATRAALANRLHSITGRSGVKAVDLIFVTHGLSSKVVFSDGKVTMDDVRKDIVRKLSSRRRAKLRAVFSTACYGASHRAAWRGAGFKVVSGSRRIYADSAVSYPAFLTVWARGRAFEDAVAAANKADPLRVQDGLAKPILKKWGISQWRDVNSVRLVSGYRYMRLTDVP